MTPTPHPLLAAFPLKQLTIPRGSSKLTFEQQGTSALGKCVAFWDSL
jgi:hypothetical protein